MTNNPVSPGDRARADARQARRALLADLARLERAVVWGRFPPALCRRLAAHLAPAVRLAERARRAVAEGRVVW